jgi:DNA (cytosine-5)-methyltransferase 1
MRYLSLFSGIEAASLAWQSLGWECVGVAEVDPFCCELLAQRFPTVPNLGDVTAPDFIERAKSLAPDLVVGGSPCQSFSVAGLGKSLSDARGNLTLRFVEVVRGIDPDFVVWENVPGILPKRDNPFGCFLAGLVGADAPLVPPVGSRWTNAGLVAGPKRTAAWRVLDAQWYGVAQRRSRVFVVSGRARDFRCAEILLEQPCVRRDPPPRGTPGQGVAADVAGSLGGGSGKRGWCDDTDRASFVACFGGNNTGGAIDVATACNAHGGTGRSDFESETFVAGTLCGSGRAAGSATQQDAESGLLVAHSLRANGFDASEDGTGRGTPLVPVQCNGSNIGTELPCLRRGDGGTTSGVPCVAFSSKDHGADAGEVCPTLRSAGHDGSHANGGGPPAVCIAENQRGEIREMDVAPALGGGGGKPGSGYPAVAFHTTQDPISGDVSPCIGQGSEQRSGSIAVGISLRGRAGGGTAELGGEQSCAVRASQGGGDKPHVLSGMAVRRLTPRECERLQGMLDDWTLVTIRGKPAADGPRYKSIGNSMAVTVMRWIGRRIDGGGAR